MKIFLTFILICVFSFAHISESRAGLDPRAKVMATMSVYGTAGGILLGFASMAFKSNGRAIFQGASIGLWSGILFGSYVIISHSLQQGGGSSEAPVDPEDSSYPDDTGSPYYDDGEGEEEGDEDGYSMNPYWIKHEYKLSNNLIGDKNLIKNNLTTVYMDMVKISF